MALRCRSQGQAHRDWLRNMPLGVEPLGCGLSVGDAGLTGSKV
jgi:hypothetical protein